MNINHHNFAQSKMTDNEQRGFGRTDHRFFLNLKNCVPLVTESLVEEDELNKSESCYVLGYN